MNNTNFDFVREQNIPLYLQIKNYLLWLIQSGELKDSSYLPSEAKLSEMFKVSRGTVRQAEEELVKEGILVKKHGFGVQVSRPKKNYYDLTSHVKLGLFKELEKSGRNPHIEIIDQKVVKASKKLAVMLKVPLDTDLYYISRIFNGDGNPIAHAYTYLPKEIFPDLFNKDLQRRSLIDLIIKVYGVTLSKATEEIEPSICDSDIAGILGMQKGEPILKMNKLLFSINQPVEYSLLHLNTKYCTYVVTTKI